MHLKLFVVKLQGNLRCLVSSHLCSRFLRPSRSEWSTPGFCHTLRSGNSSYAMATTDITQNTKFILSLASAEVSFCAMYHKLLGLCNEKYHFYR